jgi:hypothetical protein
MQRAALRAAAEAERYLDGRSMMDGLDLTPLETKVFNAAADPDITKRRIRSVVIFGLIAVGCVLALAARAESVWLVVTVSLVYMLITICEKIAFGMGVLVYKSVIRKLAGRIAELENQNASAS